MITCFPGKGQCCHILLHSAGCLWLFHEWPRVPFIWEHCEKHRKCAQPLFWSCLICSINPFLLPLPDLCSLLLRLLPDCWRHPLGGLLIGEEGRRTFPSHAFLSTALMSEEHDADEAASMRFLDWRWINPSWQRSVPTNDMVHAHQGNPLRLGGYSWIGYHVLFWPCSATNMLITMDRDTMGWWALYAEICGNRLWFGQWFDVSWNL